jgi:hypothetical protein
MIDATPHVSIGDGATLFAPRYLFVKLPVRTNTRSRIASAHGLRTNTGELKDIYQAKVAASTASAQCVPIRSRRRERHCRVEKLRLRQAASAVRIILARSILR